MKAFVCCLLVFACTAGAADVLFSDDFNSGWDEGTRWGDIRGTGRWEDSWISHTPGGGTDGSGGLLFAVDYRRAGLAYIGDDYHGPNALTGIEHLTIEVDVKLAQDNNEKVGLLWRGEVTAEKSDGDRHYNGYSFLIVQQEHTATENISILERHPDPRNFEEPSTRIAKAYHDIRTETWYHLTMVIDGTRMTGYIDGQKLVEASSSTFSAGNDLTGLMTYMDSEHFDRRWDEDPVAGSKGFAVFDNFVVTQGVLHPGVSSIREEHFSLVRPSESVRSRGARVLTISGRAVPQTMRRSHGAVVVVPGPAGEANVPFLATYELRK